ncbi:hypothetical protein BXU09_14780 [Deinococcus sp. LM3]|nr:hypothetical protein BXU09_14780 [Deinococcus sp. LM3]
MWEWLNISKSENRCSVLPNPIDTTVFYSDKDKGESFRKDFGIPLDAFVIGRVGQAIEAKWTPDIVYIFKEIAKMNLDVWLLLVGSPPSILSEIRGLDNSLRNRIILIDRINDDSSLLECYNAMDIFVHSARIGESFGLVIIEAMMCEIPVFSIGNIWRNNAQYEILSSVDDRLYCKNRTELLNNIGSIISDKGEMQRIGSISRKFVLKNYNLLDVTDKALSTFKSIINGEQYINSDARRANILVKECVRSSIKIKAIILSKIMRSNILAKRAIRLIKVLRK